MLASVNNLVFLYVVGVLNVLLGFFAVRYLRRANGGHPSSSGEMNGPRWDEGAADEALAPEEMEDLLGGDPEAQNDAEEFDEPFAAADPLDPREAFGDDELEEEARIPGTLPPTLNPLADELAGAEISLVGFVTQLKEDPASEETESAGDQVSELGQRLLVTLQTTTDQLERLDVPQEATRDRLISELAEQWSNMSHVLGKLWESGGEGAPGSAERMLEASQELLNACRSSRESVSAAMEEVVRE